MQWTVYDKSGNSLGIVEGNSLHEANDKAYREFHNYNSVALRDSNGYGWYEVGYKIRPLGSLGQFYKQLNLICYARNSTEAFDQLRSHWGHMYDFGPPCYVHFHGKTKPQPSA